MRILHIVESLSRCSGITNFVVNYYKCSLSRTDITMDFIYFKEDNNSFKEFLTTTGAKCYHLELPSPTNILKTLKHYSDFFSKYGSEYDIVHLHEVVLSHIILPFRKAWYTKSDYSCAFHQTQYKKWTWVFEELGPYS